MANQPIITRSVVSQIISILDYCYRLGVEAAHETEDDGLAREFLARTKEPGVYGVFSDTPLYTTWQEWTLRLMAKARSTAWDGTMVRFLSRIGRFGSNYLSAFLVCSMAFYCKGIAGYMASPSVVDFAQFQSRNRVWWTKKGLKAINNRTYVDEVQLMTFDLQRRDEAVWATKPAYEAKKIALTAKQYEMFRRAVGLVMVNGK